MIRRYAVGCAVIVLAAMAVSVLVYASTPVQYAASCQFRVMRPQANASGSDFFAFENSLAQSEVNATALGSVFDAVAARAGISSSTLKREATLSGPAQNESSFLVTVTDADSNRSGALANALCRGIVDQVTQKVAADRTAEASKITDRIGALQNDLGALSAQGAGHPPSGVTSSQVNAYQTAIQRLQAQLAAFLSETPDLIDVTAQAGPGAPSDSRGLTRDLVIGAVAAVLACFLLILVGEMVTEHRRLQGRRSELLTSMSLPPENVGTTR